MSTYIGMLNQNSSGQMSLKDLQTWTTILALIVAALSIFAGTQLARSNVDITCRRTTTDTGACTNGSWSAWSVVSQSGGQVTEQRTYTGLRNIITGQFSVTGNIHALAYCGSGLSNSAFTSGTITSQNIACQIVETRVRTGGGTGTNQNMTIISQTQQVTNGAVLDTISVSGGYNMYQQVVDARLATSSIRAVPSIVRAGETSNITWTSDHVKSCTVVGTNGDSWPLTPQDGPKPAALTGSETTSPLQTQTTYTLTCLTALGTALVDKAVVNILPVFEEQ